MTKITFEGDNIAEIKENIKAFFSGEADGSGENGDSGDSKPKRSHTKKAEAAPAKITHESIRKWVSENEDKKAEVRDLINDMGYDAIADIPEEKLEKVLTKIKAL